ncbi:hypothetical protein [Pseudomonas yamanorum]|uniref:Uncharacterized protein n=1 Tax=Pseudomonas yamanorum TaxID=515393 RepID=A0AAJ3H6F7_9PSED|nr:hypothetical protein [Pseudomonas yamanorum]NWD44158.1 hypothetical protein [Pseudomonas yamanorum]
MNIDEDTCEWLGCPTPLEMYKHHCSMIEDEVADLQVQLRKARANISGLVQMNDVLAAGKAKAENELKAALVELDEVKLASTEPGILSIKLVAEQRDYLLRENQRLLTELKSLKEPSA